MKILLIFFISWLYGMADDGFLSNDEYAKMLYQNPRGIGCHMCHGLKGEGGVLAQNKIVKKDEIILRDIKAPQINSLTMKRFKKAFVKKQKYMPTYYLSDSELAYIYFYLIKQKKEN